MSLASPRVLRNALLRDGELRDVVLHGATVAEVVAPGTGQGEVEVDLEGRLLLTAGSDAHAHLDKAYTWDAIKPPFGDLLGAIAAFHDFQEQLTTEDTYARARRAALRLLANGTTAVRSHVNILPGEDPFRGVDAMVQLRDDLAHVMDIQLVALPPIGTPDAIIEEALDRGLDLVGGAPHLEPDAIGDVRRLLALAERRGVGVDLHTDEGLDGPITLGEFARLVAEWPADRIRTAGHCVRLGTMDPTELAPIVKAVAASGIGIVTNPITNLYLQGWDNPVATPRGLTAIDALRAGGALVSAGADNVRDPFNPIGRSDAFETAALLVSVGHVPLDDAWDMCSSAGRAVMGLPAADVIPGGAAEFVAIASTNVGEAIAEAPADRVVIHRGRVVATTTVAQELRLAHSPSPLQGGAHA